MGTLNFDHEVFKHNDIPNSFIDDSHNFKVTIWEVDTLQIFFFCKKVINETTVVLSIPRIWTCMWHTFCKYYISVHENFLVR